MNELSLYIYIYIYNAFVKTKLGRNEGLFFCGLWDVGLEQRSHQVRSSFSARGL